MMMNQGQREHYEHDEQLEALLDEALAPEPLPPGLSDRLVAASVEASLEANLEASQPLPISQAQPEPERAWTGAGGSSWSHGLSALATAAAIALVMLGAWALFEPRSALEPAPFDAVAAIERDLGALDQAATVRLDPMDERIELLALQLEMTQLNPLWPTGEPLEELARDAETYQLIHEWDLAWAY